MRHAGMRRADGNVVVIDRRAHCVDDTRHGLLYDLERHVAAVHQREHTLGKRPEFPELLDADIGLGKERIELEHFDVVAVAGIGFAHHAEQSGKVFSVEPLPLPFIVGHKGFAQRKDGIDALLDRLGRSAGNFGYLSA